MGIKLTQAVDNKLKFEVGDFVISKDKSVVGIIYGSANAADFQKRVAWSSGICTIFDPGQLKLFRGTIEVTA